MNHQITYLLLLTGIVFLIMGVYSYSQGATVDLDKLPIANVTEIRETSLNENSTPLNVTVVRTNSTYEPTNETIEQDNTTDFEEITGPTAYELAQQNQTEEEAQKEVSDEEVTEEGPTEESTVSEATEIVKKVNKTIPKKEYGFFKKKASFSTDEYYIYKTDKNGVLDLGDGNGEREFIIIPVD